MKTLVLMGMGGVIAWVAFKHLEKKHRNKQRRPYAVPRGINTYDASPAPAGFGAAAVYAAGMSPDAVDIGDYRPAFAPALGVMNA